MKLCWIERNGLCTVSMGRVCIQRSNCEILLNPALLIMFAATLRTRKGEIHHLELLLFNMPLFRMRIVCPDERLKRKKETMRHKRAHTHTNSVASVIYVAEKYMNFHRRPENNC